MGSATTSSAAATSETGIQLKGTGIYLSAVGHGQVGLDGRGEDPTIDTDGTYSLNDGPYKSLPDFGATLQLVAPAGG